MIRKLLLLITLLVSLYGRENPFFPSVGEEDLLITSNKDMGLPKLKRVTLSLPSDARVVESITVNYKNLDGSKSTKKITLQNSIDWHLPLFISQNYLQVEKTQKQKKATKSSTKYKKIGQIKYATFLNANKVLKVVTQDKMIRNFTLVKPHRVVLDFKKNVHLKSYSKSNNTIFKKIKVGNHDGYYRVVIELDGYYNLEVKKSYDGYSVRVK